MSTARKAKDAAKLNRAALDQIDKTLRSMALRPGMYGDALAVECQARLAMRLRRTLLGAKPDERGSFAAHWESVYGGLILDWFGVVSVGASAFLRDDKIGWFVAEMYYRERQKVPDPKGSTEDIEGRVLFATEFLRLRDEWQAATGGLSNPHKRIAHPAYRAIVSRGWPIARHILRDLAKNNDPAMWGPALREITGENPVPKGHAGNLRKIAKDWLRWGAEIGLSPAVPRR